MSNFNNNPFQFNSNASQSSSANNNNANNNAPNLFVHPSMPPPAYPGRATNPFASNAGFQNFTLPQTAVVPPFSSASSFSSFRMEPNRPIASPSGSFQPPSRAKNVMGSSQFTSFQMPRPASIWSGEQKGPSFSSTSINPNNTQFPIQNVFGNRSTSSFPVASQQQSFSTFSSSTPSFSSTSASASPSFLAPSQSSFSTSTSGNPSFVPSTQPSFSVPSSQPLFSVSSSQPNFSVPSTQPSFFVPSSQPNFVASSQPKFTTLQSSQQKFPPFQSSTPSETFKFQNPSDSKMYSNRPPHQPNTTPTDPFSGPTFGQKIDQPFTTSNNVFGTISSAGSSNSDTTQNQQPQPNLFSTNQWQQPPFKQPLTTEKESKPVFEVAAKEEQPSNNLNPEVKNPNEISEMDLRKRSLVRQPRKQSVSSLRKSPGLFTKAVAGLKTSPDKVSTFKQATYPPVERSRERSRRLSVKSGDGVVASPEEIKTFTSLVCKNIPDDLNNKPTLLQHFGRFGIVQKIFCNLSKQSATVFFRTHDAAEAAKSFGKTIRPDREPLSLFWSRTPRTGSESGSSSASTKHQDVKKILGSAQERKYRADDEVNKELESMGGSAKSLAPPKLLDRPKDRPSPKHQSTYLEPQGQQFIQETAARTSHDKYVTLDNNDKTLRTGLRKQSSLATAKAIVGTCQDMCPEKERYMREDRGQLHPYETINQDTSGETLCDHRKAIKEYSRSSADQEEPLPHELRPPKVLSMTMDYLVCNIMDIFENAQGSAVEWYDFVWNRTRSIRKDIIQQHLCDHVTVDVVEKCARFHIHCSARLCEEDMMAFDQKYNNENLTNCLQTLKHLYADLRAKGEFCVNEAEFVSYDLLLNLNEGNVIWQIMVMLTDLQQSPQIRLALECANAISANNYVRFFKLVRRSSYLTACILQRYFSQVRMKGFQGFVKAYCPNPTYAVHIPIRKLIDLFGFDDHTEASEFASFHNLVVELDKVILDRSRFCVPESAIPLKRAKVVIESKRTCSVGELVNGGPLSVNPMAYYVPQNSFDENGFLKRETATHYELHKQQGLDQKLNPFLSPRKIVDEPDRTTDLINKAEDVANEILTEATASITEKVAKAELGQYLIFAKNTAEVASACLKEVCTGIIRDVACEGFKISRAEELRLRLQKEAEELAKKRELEKQKEECAADLLDTIIRVVVAQETVQIVYQELSEEVAICKARFIEKTSCEMAASLCGTWTDEMIWKLCLDIYSSEAEHRRITLARVSEKLSIWKSAGFFKIWRTQVLKRKRLRSSMELFPSSVLCSSYITRQNNPSHFYPKLNIVSPLQSEEDRNRTNKLLDMSLLSDDLEGSIRQSYIDLNGIAKQNVYHGKNMTNEWRRNQHIYWKLLVTLTSTVEHENHLTEWLQQKFVQPNSKNEPNKSHNEIVSAVSYKNNQRPSTAISVKIVQPTSWNEVSRLQLQGTQGFVYVLEFPKDCDDYILEAICNQERSRMLSMLHAMAPTPSVPLLIVAVSYHEVAIDDLCHLLKLNSLLNENLISNCELIQLNHKLNEPHSTRTLTEGLKWLGNSCPHPPSLIIEDINEYLNKTNVEYFVPFTQQFKSANVNDFSLVNTFVRCFNHVVEHAANCASDAALETISWPASEFVGKYSDLPEANWNNSNHLKQLSHLIRSYRLPMFQDDFYVCSDWSALCDLFWKYFGRLQDADWSRKMFLHAKLQRVLETSFQKYKLLADDNSLKPWQLLPWKEIINIFVDYHLTIASVNIDVVYDLTTYRSFVKPIDWNPIVVKELDITPLTPTKRKHDSKSTPSKRKSIDVFKSPDPLIELNQSCMELKRQLDIERTRSEDFDKYLEKVLRE